MAVATQWRHSSHGARTGLCYDACLPVLRLKLRQWKRTLNAGELERLDIENTEVDALLEDIQVIEWGLLEAQRERFESAQAAAAGASGVNGDSF